MEDLNGSNKGFTLVELIIVIGIMSVLLTAVVYGTGLAGAKDAAGCAEKVATTLQNSRLTTMGKVDGAVSTTIERNGSREIVVVESMSGVETRRTVVGKAAVEISFSVDGGTMRKLEDSGSIVIQFDRSSGGMKRTADGGSHYYTAIEFSRGGRASTVTIVPLTGRVSTD